MVTFYIQRYTAEDFVFVKGLQSLMNKKVDINKYCKVLIKETRVCGFFTLLYQHGLMLNFSRRQ